MSKELMEYFNKQPRLGCMSTSGKDGKVNVACFGSPRMVDEKTAGSGSGLRYCNFSLESSIKKLALSFLEKPSAS